MVLTDRRTRLKNRIHATLSKCGITIEDTSDISNVKGRTAMSRALDLLPEHTRFWVTELLAEIDSVEASIKTFEERIAGG